LNAAVKKLPISEPKRPPKHLKPATRRFFEAICTEFVMEEHESRILQLACEAWDRRQQAIEDIAENGITFVNKYGERKSNPAVNIEQTSRLQFARLMRQLNLSEEPPEDRPPALKYGRKR
jgi:P27 family predicted phage terminase small subunit